MKKGGPFIALAIAFLAFGVASSPAFLALGVVFLVIGLSQSRRT